MNKLTASLIAAGLFAGMGAPVMAADDPVSYNLGLSSNYIWRGATQTSDKVAVQGGADYAKDAISFGVWASNVDFGGSATGAEVDLYGSYGAKAGEMDWSVGFIYYYFSVSGVAATTDITASVGTGPVSATAYYNLDSKKTNIELGGEFEAMKGLTVGATVGSGVAGDAAEGSYYDLSATYATEAADLKAGYADAPGAGSEPKFYVMVSKSF